MKSGMVIVLGLVLLVSGSVVSAAPRESRDTSWIERMDTDGDGKISRDEWTSYYSERFTKTDANEDGFITADEMKSSGRAGRGGREGRGEGSEE